MHLALSNVTLLPALLVVLLILAVVALMQRRRRGSSSAGRNRGSSGARMNSRLGVAPNPRFAASRRLAAAPSGPFAAAQSITAAQPFAAAQAFAVTQTIPAEQPFADLPRIASEPADPFAAQPAQHLGAEPVSPAAAAEPSWSVGPVASVSVLASFTEEADNARPSFAPSNSGVAFPTRARALTLLVGHLLATLGILVLSLASTPLGPHISHVGGTPVGLIAVLGVLVGIGCAVVVAARVQHDIMGGGWYEGFSPRYISPEVARYVISPSGISAAARRLRYSPAWLIFVEYALLVTSVLILLDRITAR